ESLKEDPGSANSQVHWRNEKSRYADKALTIYENLEADLAPGLKPGPDDPPLSRDEQDILRRASFAALALQFELGNFEGALSRARTLAKRYESQAECLTAYLNIFRCCTVIVNNSSQLTEEARADKYREARAALDKAREALNGPLKALP